MLDQVVFVVLGNPVSLLGVLIGGVVILGAYWLYQAVSQLWR